jgi:hypothetical protein
MYFSKVQYFEKLIFGGCLVIRQMSRPQNKPSLFPSLRRFVDQLSEHILGAKDTTNLTPFTFFPQITGFDHCLISRSSWLPPHVSGLPSPLLLFIFVLFRFITASSASFSN